MARQDLLRALPSVRAVVEDDRLHGVPHVVAVSAARESVDAVRQRVLAGEAVEDVAEAVVAGAVSRASAARARRLVGVINATGVVLHTNLGRAPLAAEVAAAVHDVAAGYANVEMHLDSGARGGRLDGVAGPLRMAVPACEAAIAVNNCAAAVLLALTALARDREVVVSRGELVEIGGSFRVPDVVSAGGARLVEVGTTNRCRAADFGQAAGPETAVFLRVHPSNFRMVGFTERPDRRELVEIAHKQGILVVEDLGSGLVGEPPVHGVGLEHERVDAALDAGVDLVCFSGDKLLGGPQAGIIAGRAEVVARLRRHPLYRALRLDKLGLVALEATLRMVAEGRADSIPARALLQRSEVSLRAAAHHLAAQIPGAEVVPDVSVTGGGALPGRELPTFVVVVPSDDPEALARQLRLGSPAVVARVAQGSLRLDPRTLIDGQMDALVGAVLAAID